MNSTVFYLSNLKTSIRAKGSNSKSSTNLNRIKSERNSDQNYFEIANQEFRKMRKKLTLERLSISNWQKNRKPIHHIKKLDRLRQEKSFDAQLLLHRKDKKFMRKLSSFKKPNRRGSGFLYSSFKGRVSEDSDSVYVSDPDEAMDQFLTFADMMRFTKRANLVTQFRRKS